MRAYCHSDNFEGVTSILYHNNGYGTFTDVSAKAGIANPQGKGLGVSFADSGGDGCTDSFRNVNNPSGVGGLTFGFSGWSTYLFDYDNDGWEDLVVAQGHVMGTAETGWEYHHRHEIEPRRHRLSR